MPLPLLSLVPSRTGVRGALDGVSHALRRTDTVHTASGFGALQGNDSGASNAAVRGYALESNVTGSLNSAHDTGSGAR